LFILKDTSYFSELTLSTNCKELTIWISGEHKCSISSSNIFGDDPLDSLFKSIKIKEYTEAEKFKTWKEIPIIKSLRDTKNLLLRHVKASQ
jgi:hypothetical protein